MNKNLYLARHSDIFRNRLMSSCFWLVLREQ